MKKIVSLLLTATLAISCLVGCGSSNAKNDTQSKGDDKVKIGIVLDVGGVNDGSFNQTSWEGLQRAMKELGVDGKYLESAKESDYAPNIEALMDDDCDLIICVGYMLADATQKAAQANPDQKFAIIDDATCADLKNVECLMFKQEQASYLVGYVAGLTTKSNNVGFVLGMENETMNLFGYGYCAGVLDANKDAKIQQINANAFSDPALGKSSAQNMISSGADVIFHAAGATGLGVIEACKAAHATDANIFAIGVDTDQASLAPDTVITSAMKRVDNAVYDVCKQVKEGTYKAGVTTYDLAVGGVDIAPTQDLLTPEVIKALDDVKAKIVSGEVEVPDSKDAFDAKYGKDVYTLDDK